MKLKIIAILCLSFFAANVWAADELIPSALIQLTEGGYFSANAFIVDKKERKLSVWQKTAGGFTKVAEYPSDIGKKEGNKTSKGDYRTPEGIYFLQEHKSDKELDYSKYGHNAYTTDYPNLFDRRESKSGNGIWLHSIPETQTLERGSQGCVVIRNRALDEVAKYIDLRKTPIIIHDKVDYVTSESIEAEQKEMNQFITQWQNAWSSKNLEAYISNYSDHFEAMKMDRSKWKEFKASLNEKYASIDVKFSKPAVYKHKSEYIVRLLQHYRSDQKEDFGEKFLYVAKESGGLKIIAEEWQPLEKEQVLAELATHGPCCQANAEGVRKAANQN